MYYIYIDNNELINGYGEIRLISENTLNYEVTEELYNDFKTLKTVEEQNAKYMWNGTDVVLNSDYEEIIAEKEKEKQKKLLLEQIDDIDKKRIRAICEPSIKDKTTGETWLDYYNKQVAELRTEINKLQNPETENNEPETENDLLGINEIPFET